MAQDISINLGGGNGGVTERAIQLIALLTVLSIAPSILVMMTSFTRIVVVLSLLRTALGTIRRGEADADAGRVVQAQGEGPGRPRPTPAPSR